MVLLIRWWPIVYLFVCNYLCVCVGRGESVRVSIVWTLVYVLSENGWRNEALNYLAAWVSSGTQHVFLIAWRRYPPRIDSWKLGRTWWGSKASCRCDYHKAALLNYPLIGQVDSAHLHQLSVNYFKFCASVIQPCCVCRLFIFLYLREKGRENPS